MFVFLTSKFWCFQVVLRKTSLLRKKKVCSINMYKLCLFIYKNKTKQRNKNQDNRIQDCLIIGAERTVLDYDSRCFFKGIMY